MSPKRERGRSQADRAAKIVGRLGSVYAIAIVSYLERVASGAVAAPRRGRGFSRTRIAQDSGVPLHMLTAVWEAIRPLLDRMTAEARPAVEVAQEAVSPEGDQVAVPADGLRDPPGFRAAFDFHIRRHGDTVHSLHRHVISRGGRVNRSTLAVWRRGGKAPQSEDSLRILGIIEEKYDLPKGYFASKGGRAPRAVSRKPMPGVSRAEARRLAWHLPDDFGDRSPRERAEILAWVRTVIISGATDYRRYQAAALQHRYGLQFWVPGGLKTRRRPSAHPAPEALNAEMAAYVLFKTSTLTPVGYRRLGHWGAETAAQRMEHLGLLFGALAAPPGGPIQGEGAPLADLSLGLLNFPAVWDWYVRWRERRRGFYTAWEIDLLVVGASLTRAGTGYLRQTPQLAEGLRPIPGMVEPGDVEAVQGDWDGACEKTHLHCLARIKEIQHVVRVHRDPFEPILPILEADSPLAEYRKITDEILRRMPDARRYPKATAEAVRSFLMLRLSTSKTRSSSSRTCAVWRRQCSRMLASGTKMARSQSAPSSSGVRGYQPANSSFMTGRSTSHG
jgi:hypothetical protein